MLAPHIHHHISHNWSRYKEGVGLHSTRGLVSLTARSKHGGLLTTERWVPVELLKKYKEKPTRDVNSNNVARATAFTTVPLPFKRQRFSSLPGSRRSEHSHQPWGEKCVHEGVNFTGLTTKPRSQRPSPRPSFHVLAVAGCFSYLKDGAGRGEWPRRRAVDRRRGVVVMVVAETHVG